MGTTAEKLKYLNETKAEIKNALETPYNVMRDYPELIKKYIDNQPTKVVTDGICENAVDVPVKAIEINGNIRQETTEGYQLLDTSSYSTETKNGVTATRQRDGSIKVTGTATADVQFDIASFTPNSKDKVYFLSGCPAGGSISTYYLNLNVYGVNDVGEGVSFTNKTNLTYVRIKVASGVTIDKVFYLMITEGVEKKPYEPYTGGIPSPSPDYPQEITNVGENGMKIKQSGKNFINSFYNYSAGYTMTNKGVTFTLLEDGKIRVNGTATGGRAAFTFFIPDTTIKAGNYILSRGSEKVKVEAKIGNTYYSVAGSSSNISITEAQKIFYVALIVNEGLTVNNEIVYAQLEKEKGTIATGYEPYHEPIITPINLQGNILSKVGDVKDVLRVNRNGEVEIKKNIGKVVLDGSENWNLVYSKIYNNMCLYQTSVMESIINKKGILRSNNFTYSSIFNENVGEVIALRSTGKIGIALNSSRCPNYTTAEVKTWLSQHPTEVYYQLATPQIITLPSISPIELWQGTNIFKLITNLDTDFEVEYVVDKNSVTKEEE